MHQLEYVVEHFLVVLGLVYALGDLERSVLLKATMSICMGAFEPGYLELILKNPDGSGFLIGLAPMELKR